jgi:hypothetical protein
LAAPRVFVCVFAVTLQVVAPAYAQPEAVRPVEPAPVARRPVALVSVDLTGDQELITLAKSIENVLETHATLRPIYRGALYERIDDPDAIPLAAAKDKLDEAQAELGNGNFANAARFAHDGQELLWSVTPQQATHLYADLAFLRGKALLGDNRADEARAAFTLTQRLDSTRKLDLGREPPSVVTAYQQAKVAPAPIGRVSVTVGKPEEQFRGTVWIDGESVGFAPTEYVVPSGLHVIWVTDRERVTKGVEIEVKPNAVRPINVPGESASDTDKLQRLRQELARAPDDAARLVTMKAIAKLAGNVKDAVVLSLVNGKVVYQVWRSDDADRAPGFSPKHERGPKDLPVKMLEDLLPPPPIEDDGPGVVFPIPHDTTRWYKKPAYWAGIGFGASLVAAGVYFLVITLTPKDVDGPENITLVNPASSISR